MTVLRENNKFTNSISISLSGWALSQNIMIILVKYPWEMVITKTITTTDTRRKKEKKNIWNRKNNDDMTIIRIAATTIVICIWKTRRKKIIIYFPIFRNTKKRNKEWIRMRKKSINFFFFLPRKWFSILFTCSIAKKKFLFNSSIRFPAILFSICPSFSHFQSEKTSIQFLYIQFFLLYHFSTHNSHTLPSVLILSSIVKGSSHAIESNWKELTIKHSSLLHSLLSFSLDPLSLLSSLSLWWGFKERQNPVMVWACGEGLRIMRRKSALTI